MEKPIVDRWIERKAQKRSQKSKVSLLVDTETTDRNTKIGTIQQIYNLYGKPEPDKAKDLIIPFLDDKSSNVRNTAGYYISKLNIDRALRSNNQIDYAEKLRGKIDKEAVTFDQERWSDPNRWPGGIYRSAKNKKGQIEKLHKYLQDTYGKDVVKSIGGRRVQTKVPITMSDGTIIPPGEKGTLVFAGMDMTTKELSNGIVFDNFKDKAELRYNAVRVKDDDLIFLEDIPFYKQNRKIGQRERTNWLQLAQDDAKEFIREYAETIKETIITKGDASTDLYNDYDNGDSYIHESYTDKEYDLQEAAELLDQLSEHEETDSGLWEGQDPRQAISTQAAFTYSNAVVHYIGEYIKDINGIVSGIEGTEDQETGDLVLAEQDIERAIYESIGEMPPTVAPPQPPKPDMGGIEPLDKFGITKVGQQKPLQIKVIYDNGGKTADRYTIIFDEPGSEAGMFQALDLSDNPESPNMGVSMWADGVYPNSELGEEIQFNELPENVQKHVLRRIDQKSVEMSSNIEPLEKFGHCPQLGTKKKEGKMDLNKVIVDLWDRGIIGDKKVEALQRTPNRRLVQSELVKIAKTNGLGDILKVLADNQDGKVETDDRRGYPEGNREETTNQPSAEGKEQRLPGVAEPGEKGVSPTGKEDRLPGVAEPAKTPWDGWKRKYEERENDIKDSKPGASAGGTDERLPGNKEGEHSPKGPYPGTHYGKKVDELNACIKAQDFNGIARVAKELEDIKKTAQHRTPFEISKDQKERDRKIEGAPHEPKISPSPQTSLGDPDSKINEQAHGKTKDSLDTVGEVNPNPAVDKVKGTPDKLGNPESQIDLTKSLRGMFTGVEGDSEGKGETKEGQLEDFHLENKGEPKFEWTTIPGETDQEPRTIKTTPDLTEQKSTTVPGIGKGEDNQPPGKGALAVKCKACKNEMVLSAADEKIWMDLGKTICKCGNLIEAEVDMKIDTDMFSGVPKSDGIEVQSLGNKKTGKKKAKKAQVNWVKTAAEKGESVLDRFFRMKKEAKKGQITIDENLPEVGAAPDRKEEDEAHDYDKDYKDKFLKDTKPQKGEQKSEDHDYKGPVEDLLKDGPKPLETQKDREKELKKGQSSHGIPYNIGESIVDKSTGDRGVIDFVDKSQEAQLWYIVNLDNGRQIWVPHNRLKKGQLLNEEPMPLEGSDTLGGDCPKCGAVWDEDTRAEYYDMGEVDCPECGEHVSSFDKEGQKKDDGRGSKTPERVKELAEDLKGKAEEPYGLATHIMEKERRKVPHRGPGDGRKLKYDEVKKLPREGRVAIFDNGGKSEDRYFVVVGNRAYTITNSGIGTFIGDARKFDMTHIVKATKRVATKDVPARVQRAIFRRVVGTRRGQLSETDPMQMTTGKPTSEIEKIKPTRKPQDTPLDVVMTPSIDRSKGAGTPIDPTYLAETIVRGLRYSHYHTAQEGFNHIIRATKDITSDQIEKLQGLMKELGYDVSEQKGDIVKTGRNIKGVTEEDVIEYLNTLRSAGVDQYTAQSLITKKFNLPENIAAVIVQRWAEENQRFLSVSKM